MRGRVPPLGRHLVDQEPSHLHLVGSLLHRRDRQAGRVPQLLERTQHLHRQHPPVRDESRERGTRPESHAGDADAPGVQQRVAEDTVRLLASLHRGEVVRHVEREGVHRREVDELEDLDAPVGPAELFRHVLELVLLHRDETLLLDLEALHDLVAAHLDILLAAELLVPDRRHVFSVEQVEADPLGGLEGRMEADRNRDQAEGDVSAPEAWHRITPPEGPQTRCQPRPDSASKRTPTNSARKGDKLPPPRAPHDADCSRGSTPASSPGPPTTTPVASPPTPRWAASSARGDRSRARRGGAHPQFPLRPHRTWHLFTRWKRCQADAIGQLITSVLRSEEPA